MMKNTHILRGVGIALVLSLAFSTACSSDDGGGKGGDGGAASTGKTTDGDSGIDLTTGMSGDGEGDGDGGGDGKGCGGEDVEAMPIETQMLLLVDTSESMDGTPDGFEKTKWETLVDSLHVALPKVEDRIGMGLKMYPSGDTESDICSVETGIEVEVALSSENVTTILDELGSKSRTGSSQGDTPTAAALADALEYFESGPGKELGGNRYVLLATDGGPNCNDDPQVDCTCSGDISDKSCGVREKCTVNIDPSEAASACSLDGDLGSCCDVPTLCLDDGGTIAAVTALAAAGIKTIVLGMPGSEAYEDVLDALAEAGGIPSSGETKYERVDDPEELTTRLQKITVNLIRSCEIEVADPPSDANQVNVYLDGDIIFKDDEDGWMYPREADDDYSVIELVGPTCERVKSEGVGKISVKYGCDTIIR